MRAEGDRGAGERHEERGTGPVWAEAPRKKGVSTDVDSHS
jgi:hypothetical protein